LRFGELCQFFLQVHAHGWLRRPLLRQKDTRFLHRPNQQFTLLPVENQTVLGLAFATSEVVPFKKGADSWMLDIRQEGLPIAVALRRPSKYSASSP
jgi:hypothetical protein